MKRLKFFGSVGCAWLLLAALAGAQAQAPAVPTVPGDAAAHGARVQERERLQREREAIEKTLQQAEVGCYQRFAVEDCLRKARRSAREARAQVHQRELVVDEAERRERAAQRLGDVHERESTRVPPTPPAQPAQRPTQADIDRQAQERARVRQDKRAVQQGRQAQAREAAAQADAARERRVQKQQAAAEHKARVLKSQADKAAAGQQPAAPLPPPSP